MPGHAAGGEHRRGRRPLARSGDYVNNGIETAGGAFPDATNQVAFHCYDKGTHRWTRVPGAFGAAPIVNARPVMSDNSADRIARFDAYAAR
jgi:hypothetical protein